MPRLTRPSDLDTPAASLRRPGHPGRLVAAVGLVAVLQGTALAGVARAAPASPRLSLTASPSTRVGLQIFANANLMNGANPTGTVTFKLFAPGDTTCSSPVFTSTVPVTGTSVNSERFTAPHAGTWRWIGSYSGDAGNTAAGPTACSEPGSTVVVDKARTVLAVNAALLTVGAPAVHATATLSGGVRPTGKITFSLYLELPVDLFCSSPPLFTSTVAVGGAGTYDSGNFTPTSSGTYKWRAIYSGDDDNLGVSLTSCLDAAASVVVTLAQPAGSPPAPSSRYTALTPARILDTRDGTGGVTGPLAPGSTVQVPVAGRGGTPAAGVAAVAMNVSVTAPTAAGYVSLYPAGEPRPPTATLNFAAGETVSILAVVGVGSDGKVAVSNATGATHVIFDVAGWYSEAGGGDRGRYQPVVPARVLDTREGSAGSVRLGPNASLDVALAGRGGVPTTGAEAAVLNVAAVAPSAAGFVTVFPAGQPRPGTANVNFVAGDTVSNRVITKLGAGGKATIYNASGSVDVVVDVSGWFTDASAPGTAGAFESLTPARTLDTRDATGDVGPLAAGGSVDVQVTGRGGVPESGVSAVVLVATVTQPAGAGYLTVSPAGTARPTAADVNFDAGETRANLVVVKVGAGGKVSLFSPVGAHVVFDVAGWFS